MQIRSRTDRSVPALIMGLGHPRQTAFLGSLSSAGIPVHAIHTELTAHRYSRRLSSFNLLNIDPEEQLRHLEKFGRETGGILIPTNDEYVALALQLLFLCGSESMGNHDSNIVDADSVD